MNTYIKPTATSNTLSLRAKSMNPVHILRAPRLKAASAWTSGALDSSDDQLVGFSLDIWEVQESSKSGVDVDRKLDRYS